jgi:AraC-like DNA-binding protein
LIHYFENTMTPPLAASIECLWSAFSLEMLETREKQRVVPDGCPELIIHLAEPFERLIDGIWCIQPRIFLAGTLTSPWTLRPGTKVLTLGVRFRPGRVRNFLPIDMKSAVDREVPLAEILGQNAENEFLESLKSRDRSELFPSLETWLTGRKRLQSPTKSTPTVQALELLLASQGRYAIDQLAADCGSNRRSLERLFARDLGITPKFFARIVRLNAVFATLDDQDRLTGVDLALEMGYFDQAHLLREARLLAGRRLSKSRETDGSLARHFTEPNRLRQLLRTALDDAPG